MVSDRSVTVPKPFSNQLLQLQEESPWGNRQVADHLQVKTQWKLCEPYAFLSLRARRVRMCDWGLNELLTPFYAVQCRAINTTLVFYDLFGQDFANLYAFQYHAHEKNVPSLNIYKRITFHHTGVWRSYVIRSFKRLYLH